jgi:hypothetical protein
MKLLLGILIPLLIATSLSGCNAMKTKDSVASACEKGIQNLNDRLRSRSLAVHQTNVSRAHSLLVSAQVQYQFAEYPGCLDKVKRGQDYLSGRQTAVYSRLSL